MAIPGRARGIGSAADLLSLSLAVTALIVLPTFAMQAGGARTTPLTAHVIRSAGPACVFALEQFDQRTSYSRASLAFLAVYSVFVLASNVVDGWRDQPTLVRRASLSSRGSTSAAKYGNSSR
jgi:hypothetical protein